VDPTSAQPNRIMWLPAGKGFKYANQPSSALAVGPGGTPAILSFANVKLNSRVLVTLYFSISGIVFPSMLS